jgi:hypothetical protein
MDQSLHGLAALLVELHQYKEIEHPFPF